MRQHIFEIEDGGECYWWSAETHDEAREMHRDYIRKSCGEESKCGIPTVLPDNRKLTIEGEEYTAGAWADMFKDKPVPMVGTTAV